MKLDEMLTQSGSIKFGYTSAWVDVPFVAAEEFNRHAWVDLRNDISLLKELPELQIAPELGKCLTSLNDPAKSIFRTLGCEMEPKAPEAGKPFVWGSYIDVAFADWEQNGQIENF